MLITAKIADDAAARYSKELSEGRKPEDGYAPHEHRYKAVLRQLQGKRLPVSQIVQGGIQHYDNVVPDFEIQDHHNQPIRAKVIAIPACYLEDHQEDAEGELLTPTEEPKNPVKLLIVRLLTPWVDGFQAFKRPHHRDEHGELKQCPYCNSTNLHVSYWKGSHMYFHLCEDCRERFTTDEAVAAGQAGSGAGGVAS